MLTIQAVFSILALAIQLLTTANQPGISPELHQQAVTVANNAIATAMQYIGDNPTQTVGNSLPSVTSTPVVPPGTGSLPPPVVVSPTPTSTQNPMYSIKVLNSTINKDGGDASFQILDAIGNPVRSANPNHLIDSSYVMYDASRFVEGGQQFLVTDGCRLRGHDSPSYSIHFNGIQNNPGILIDSDNLTIHVEFCGNIAEGKVELK